MNPFNIVEPKNEEIKIHLGIQDVKRLLDSNENKFYLKWLSEKSFIISLNFSFGSNLVFDSTYPNTKSDVIAEGMIKELNNSETLIKLNTKSKYILIFLLFVPLLMLTMELNFDLGIPFLFYFPFPIMFFILTTMINNEEKRLLKNFRDCLKIKI